MSEHNHGDGACGSCGDNQKQHEEAEKCLKERMGHIKNKILVLSGKGGVGKSTVSTNLAVSLARAGNKVGLLDIDIHGPSIPKLLNLEKRTLDSDGTAIIPIEYRENLKVMSIGFALPEEDDAIIWRGPMKHSVIQQFLSEVNWGDLDYLVVDSPPGTGDEPLSIAQFMNNEAKAVIVTTPQDIAITDVRKSVSFCRKLSIPILGVIENMSGFICPKCGDVIDIFKPGGGKAMAESMEISFLGRIPMEGGVVSCCDSGEPFVDKLENSEAATAFNGIVEKIIG